MIVPGTVRTGASVSERQVFNALEGMQGTEDWVVFHSLSVAQNLEQMEGEADFVVLAPGKGILIIEVKDAQSVTYKDGEWFLEKNPSPNKDPLKQLNSARRSLRGFLKARGQLGTEPIATLLWFPRLGRHDLDNQSPGDLQLFEWQIGWASDVAKPKKLIESVLERFVDFYRNNKGIDLSPKGLSPERARQLRKSILSDFEGYASPESETKRRKAQERELLDEQVLLLDMVETNNHLYFDGPPGSGKTHLLLAAAKKLALSGKKVLVTCYNLLLAEELDTAIGALDTVDVIAWNSLQLNLAGLAENPDGASGSWFEQELPVLVLEQVTANPHRASYDAILVDEFQDIAANPLHVDLLTSLTAGTIEKSTVILCGDTKQQIMRPSGEQVDALVVARALLPGIVHVRLRRNCRMSPTLAKAIGKKFYFGDRFINHRVPQNTEGGLDIIAIEPGQEVKTLAKTLRSLREHYLPENIVVLSIFGLKQSLARLILEPERSDGAIAESSDLKWLQKQLRTDTIQESSIEATTGAQVRWHSIFKYKGLDADAVVITDVSVKGIEFAHTAGLEFAETLFVGMTRAKYRCVVLDSAEYFLHQSGWVRAKKPPG